MKKRLTAIILALVMAAGMVCVAKPMDSYAASSKMVTLKNNKTYKFDVNGDKKKDKIKLIRKVKKFDLEKYTIKINGKTVYRSSVYVGYHTVRFLTFPGKRPLFFINDCGEDYDGERAFYQYRNGKLKKLATISPKSSRNAYGFHIQGNVSKVSGTNINVWTAECTNMLGGIKYWMTYRYTGSKLTPVTRIVNARVMEYDDGSVSWTNELTARRYINVYNKINGSKKVFTIEPDDDVAIRKIWVGTKKIWLKVTVDEQTGWMPIVNNVPANNQYFLDIIKYG